MPLQVRHFLHASPLLREQWGALRRARMPDDEASAAEFLAVVRMHAQGVIVAGRFAEFAHFTRAVERLLGEADPILADLLEQELVSPLASAIAGANVPAARRATSRSSPASTLAGLVTVVQRPLGAAIARGRQRHNAILDVTIGGGPFTYTRSSPR
ncbi:MAG: hypothetical protein ABI969_14085, partial [bacterium]